MGDEGCVLLYQIICLQDTPPLDEDEQAKCMRPRTACWRNSAIKCTKAAADEYSRASQAAASGA